MRALRLSSLPSESDREREVGVMGGGRVHVEEGVMDGMWCRESNYVEGGCI